MKVIIHKAGTRNQYHDVHVAVEGEEDAYVAFIVNKGVQRYGLIVMTTQLGPLRAAGENLQAQARSGLTLTEAKALAHVAAGIYLAAKALEKEEVSA